MPFRKCEFDIHFGKGIVEYDFLFDEIRAWCDEHKFANVSGKQISISGSGAWKELKVIDSATGEVIVEKKFYKSEFGDLWNSKEFGFYLQDLAENVFVIDMSNYNGADSDGSDQNDDE